MESSKLKVLSLLSASTEIVCRLGCYDLLVGRSHGCDDPELVSILPITTAPYLDPNASSLDIDKMVRVQLDNGGPVYHIYNESIIKLKPDIIITQEQCRICAVTQEDVENACNLSSSNINIITIKPLIMDDIFNDILTIAKALNVQNRGDNLIKLLKRQINHVTELCTSLKPNNNNNIRIKPKVLHIEWLEPLMGSGYWITECVEACQCEMLMGEKGGHSPILGYGIKSIELLSNINPDHIIIAPCGFSIERTYVEMQNLNQIFNSNEWLNLNAVKNDHIYIADGNKYFNRSSCGISITTEIIAEMIYPTLNGLFGHHGNKWVKFNELELYCKRDNSNPIYKNITIASSKSSSSSNYNNNIPNPPPLNNNNNNNNNSSSNEPCQHVMEQLTAMINGNYDIAWSLNSQQNQKRLGTSDDFKNIIISHPSFSCLIDTLKYNIHEIIPEKSNEKELNQFQTIIVKLIEKNSQKIYQTYYKFDLALYSNIWKTEGVRISC